MRVISGSMVALTAALTVACDAGPKAGELVMELVSPVADLGAVSFTVTAVEPEVIDTVTAACAGCRTFTTRISEREMRGIVTGDIGSGPFLRVSVSDRKVPMAYAGQLIEASAPDYELVSITGMELTIP